MQDLTVTEKLLVRCWSAVVARDGDGSAYAVASEMAARSVIVPIPTVAATLERLRLEGRLP